MGDYTIIRKCSTLCTMHEPCSISESGLCAQNNKRPVDYDALGKAVMDILTAKDELAGYYVGADDVAQALREVCP